MTASTQDFTQADFDRLNTLRFNARIVDFLRIHQTNPRWCDFSDTKGNTVRCGGTACPTVVRVHITSSSRKELEPRLMTYLKELIWMDDKGLHEFGGEIFEGVIIMLPYKELPSPDLKVTIQIIPDCHYDQDEIAYGVMAALSGVPTYKAISPFGTYQGQFVRQDTISDGKPVSYKHVALGIEVSFSHINDATDVSISKVVGNSEEDEERYKSLMYHYFDTFISTKTGQTFVRESGYRVYEAKDHRRHESLSVQVDSGSKMSFAVDIPYGLSFESFPRLRFTKDLMKYLSEALNADFVML